MEQPSPLAAIPAAQSQEVPRIDPALSGQRGRVLAHQGPSPVLALIQADGTRRTVYV
jgi:hypothetical protein